MAYKRTRADLRTLQVLKDANSLIFFGSDPAQDFDVTRVVLVRAMGKIQAGNVHSYLDQLPQRRFRTTGRTNRADDFRPAILLWIGRTRRLCTGSFVGH